MVSLRKGVFGHPKLRRNIRLRRRPRLVCQQLIERIEQRRVTSLTVSILQSAQHAIEQCRSPTALVNALGSERVGWLHAAPFLITQFFQRNELLAFATFDRHRAAVFVGQKVLQRGEQVRTQSSLLFAHSAQIPALQQKSEKTLREILRFLRPSPLSPHKAVNGPPINPAEFSKCLMCRRRFTLCLQHHAPVRSDKRRRAVISISANRTLRSHLTISRDHAPIQLKTRMESKRQTLPGSSISRVTSGFGFAGGLWCSTVA